MLSYYYIFTDCAIGRGRQFPSCQILSLTKKAPAGILIRDMKKYLSVLFVLFIIASCSQTSYKSPHEKRTLTVKNTTDYNIPEITIESRYNSKIHYKGILRSRDEIKLQNVPLCTTKVPAGYEWTLNKINDHSDTPVWVISAFKYKDETPMIEVSIFNYLSKKVTLQGTSKTVIKTIKNIGNHSIEVANIGALAQTIPPTSPTPQSLSLYDVEYNFSIKDAKLYYKKIRSSGSWVYEPEQNLYMAIQTNPNDTPPNWAADPSNPADADKIPLFFTIDYDKAAKTISIKPLPIE